MAITEIQLKEGLLAMGVTLAGYQAIQPRMNQYAQYGLTTQLRLAYLLGQCAHESGGFRSFTENLNYSAEAIVRTWPSRFKSTLDAKPYARNPQALAEEVYGMRDDLGNTETGDGWRYIGRGPISITGRAMYQAFQDDFNIPVIDQPDLLVSDLGIGFLSSVWFFACKTVHNTRLFQWADQQDIQTVTIGVNGGTIGIDNRIALTQVALGVIQESDEVIETCRKGDRGTRAVYECQWRLVDLGYIQRCDGDFGPTTQNAVCQFQREHNLSVDGVVGPNTFKELRSAVQIQEG